MLISGQFYSDIYQEEVNKLTPGGGGLKSIDNFSSSISDLFPSNKSVNSNCAWYNYY